MDFSAYQLLLPETEAKLIVDHAWRAFPRQTCGLLFGRADEDRLLVNAVPMKNEAPSHGMFLISERQLAPVLHKMEARGWLLCGCYHNHPRSAARPDRLDRAFTKMIGHWWLIYSNIQKRLNAFYWNGERFRAWRYTLYPSGKL